ncbi:MAG: hypothetical protein NTW21_43265 [Verrucomicrobia bacterium]|nr:hypothetical protein [Verrucomicrobiota bacterium]
MKSTMIAAGMLTLTALATLPAIASEEDSLKWTSVIIQCGRTPEAGNISCEARTGEMGWAACTVRAFGKEYVLPEAALAKLKGFPLSSLETTHEAGYEELGGYTVHFRFARTVNNPENKVVTEIIYVSVNKNGISVSEPRPKNNSFQGAGAETTRVVAHAGIANEDTAASTPEAVFASLVMDISALATKHAELADFTEYLKRQETKLTITFGKNLKPLTSAKNDDPVISKRRIRPSDLEANGIFLQFILDDGSDPRQATRQAPLDTVTYFPHLKKTLYAEVVLWQNASADLRQALEAILAKHKAILSGKNNQAANFDTLGLRRDGPAIERSGYNAAPAAKVSPAGESIQDLTRRLAPGGITKEEAAQIANAAYRALWGEPGGELKVTKCELNQAKTWEIEVWWDLGLPNGGARMWIHQTGGFERAEYIPGE